MLLIEFLDRRSDQADRQRGVKFPQYEFHKLSKLSVNLQSQKGYWVYYLEDLRAMELLIVQKRV